MDADAPDLAALQALAHEFDALLAVDVAHDLGSMGPMGQGQPGLQGVHGELDIVLGSFSKTLAANGGFVACREAALAEYLRYYAPTTTFSNTLSPVQIAVVRESLRIVRSAEGLQRRDALMQTVLALRQALAWQGLEVLGQPAPIVPVLLGSTPRARRIARALPAAGLLANLVEYPAVALHRARMRLQCMAAHTPAQAIEAARRLAQAIAEAEPPPAVETRPSALDDAHA
jgi:7-keto-8-aminopelargonate synthetase-like enzyme